MKKFSKFAAVILCMASLLLLASMGKLDLLIVLLPASLLFSFFSANTRQDHSELTTQKR